MIDPSLRRFLTRIRPLVAWLLALGGAVALFLGWWGVSGTALPAKQIPYLVSGGLTGVSLLVLAAALFAADDIRQRLAGLDQVEQRVAELYRLLTEEPGVVRGREVAVPGGRSYHRPDCRLVLGRDQAQEVEAAEIAERGLTPCRLCEPGPG